MANSKPKKFKYVEPDDYIPDEIYNKYFKDEDEKEKTEKKDEKKDTKKKK